MGISNKQAASYVANFKQFKTSQGSIFSEWVGNPGEKLYVVYSYGRHWPLFIAKDGQWYANSDKYSVTTSKHYGQVNPDPQAIKLNVNQMKQLIATGEVPK